MLRRNFFAKIGFLAGAALVSAKILLVDAVQPKDIEHSDTADNVYVHTTKWSSRNQVQDVETVLRLRELRTSYQASGKLLSITVNTIKNSNVDIKGVSRDVVHEAVFKTFDSKRSRDEYAALHKSIISQKKSFS